MTLSAERVATGESRELARIQETIARFPKLTNDERARIFNAIDTAPQGRAGWLAARDIDLASGTTLRPYTFAHAAKWALTPTREQILAALNYAAGVLT